VEEKVKEGVRKGEVGVRDEVGLPMVHYILNPYSEQVSTFLNLTLKPIN
jgi:hypothetical protein